VGLVVESPPVAWMSRVRTSLLAEFFKGRKSPPQTLTCVGTFSTGYTFYILNLIIHPQVNLTFSDPSCGIRMHI
jgi:hypothetical protein